MILSELCSHLCQSRRIKLLFLCIIVLVNNSIYAEGTKELAPGESERIFLYLNGDLYNNFGRYDGNTDQRLFFNIANPNQEQVYLGFSQAVSSGHYPCSGTPINSYFRIKDPNGNVVYPNRNNPNGQLLDGTTTNVANKSQVMAGPSPIVGANGYTPFIFDPQGLPAGDYYIEFSTDPNIASPGFITAIENWDITVATKSANPQPKPGRIFSTNWAFYSPSISCGTNTEYTWFDRSFNGSFHVLSKEGFVNLVDFRNSGFQPAAFNLFFNETGTDNTGNPAEDRKSINALGNTMALQSIFLNNPDPLVYPSGEYGSLVVTPVFHLCQEKEYLDACIFVEATQSGQVEVLIDIDKQEGEFVYTPNSSDVLLVFNIEPEENETIPYKRCIPWDGIDGLGNSLNNKSNLDMQVTYQQGVYHLPVYDVEYLLKGIKTTIVRPIPPSGELVNKLYYDDSNIPHATGNNSNKVEINGCDAPCHNWSNKAYGDVNTINTWFFANETTRIKDQIPTCLIDANDDNIFTPFETSINIDVLANDLGELIDTNSVTIVQDSPNSANTSTLPGGIIKYQPPSDFIGYDSIQYSICYDVLPKNALCDKAKVYINIRSATETNCTDGFDDDGDGLIDCDDSDCLPISPTKIFRNGK